MVSRQPQLEEMGALAAYLREHGRYTMMANHTVHTNPPMCISEDQLAKGLEILDQALEITDRAVGH